jgi:hypothetical protein
MGLWWRKRAEPGGGRDDSLPIIRLQDVSKTFKENAEEYVAALRQQHVLRATCYVLRAQTCYVLRPVLRAASRAT